MINLIRVEKKTKLFVETNATRLLGNRESLVSVLCSVTCNKYTKFDEKIEKTLHPFENDLTKETYVSL